MQVSDNGYAVDPSLWVKVRIPGTNVTLGVRGGPVATVLVQVAAWYDQYVEDIDQAGHSGDTPTPKIDGGEPSKVKDDWGPAVRKIRGAVKTISNHASGTAFDLNATQHPLNIKGTYTPAQLRNLKVILAWVNDPALGAENCIRAGEFYHSRTDGMHFEINAPERVVKKVAAKIEAWRDGKIDGPFNKVSKPEPKPTPTPDPGPALPSWAQSVEATVTAFPTLKKGNKGSWVYKLQGLLLANGISVGSSGMDGLFFGDTDAAVRKFQRHIGHEVTGVVTPKTWASLLTGKR